MPNIPKQGFPLEPDGPKRLEISWKFREPIRVWLDGEQVGTLQPGQDLTLPDGSTLTIREVLQKPRVLLGCELQITRNDELLGSIPIPLPAVRLKNAYWFVFIAATIQFLMVPVFILGDGPKLEMIALVTAAVVLLALGFFIRAKSKPALIAATGIVLVEATIFLYSEARHTIRESSSVNLLDILGIVASPIILLAVLQWMIPGLGAIDRLEQE